MIDKVYKTTIVALLFSFLAVSISVAADIKSESEIPLAQGSFPYFEKAKLGQPKVFWNLLNEGTTCFPLIIEGQQVDFIYNARKTKYSVVMHKCKRGTLVGDTLEMADAPKGAVYGYPEPESYLLSKVANKWIFSEVVLPGYNGFAYDSFCDDYVAYWAFVKEFYHAYVYDIKKKKLVFSKEIGPENFGTDDPWLFGQPKWDKSCQAVEFPENYLLKVKLTVGINNK
ncbi:MAG: hypothetical protein AB1306_00870 [Nitrospirota bacterium]